MGTAETHLLLTCLLGHPCSPASILEPPQPLRGSDLRPTMCGHAEYPSSKTGSLLGAGPGQWHQVDYDDDACTCWKALPSLEADPAKPFLEEQSIFGHFLVTSIGPGSRT